MTPDFLQMEVLYTDAVKADEQLREGGGVRFKNALFVVSRSDMYIVSIQQTAHSALLRGFEPCDVPDRICS